MQTTTPILDKIAADPDNGYTRHELIEKLNKRLGTPDWVELHKSPEIQRILDGINVYLNHYKSDHNLLGFAIWSDQYLAWVDNPLEKAVWIRLDILDKYYPNWPISYLLRDF
jgi:hypothetical protein